MPYICGHCRHVAESAHTITVFDKNGIEERLEILCDPCYQEWLHSLKG